MEKTFLREMNVCRRKWGLRAMRTIDETKTWNHQMRHGRGESGEFRESIEWNARKGRKRSVQRNDTLPFVALFRLPDSLDRRRTIKRLKAGWRVNFDE